MANGGGHVNRKNSKLLKLIGIHILAVAVVIPIIFPVYWLVVSALQSPQTVTKLPPSILPQTYSLYFCEEGIYGIWNCPFPVEQYFYNGGFHHSYTGSCMPGRIQL